MRKQLLVVLGMHRSGTSALTRGLTVLGVELGDNLLAPDAQINAKGFWEDVDINQLNIDIQQAIGVSWDNIAPISTELCQSETVRQFIPRAITLLNSKMAHSALFAIKDPRVSVLLPFWQQVFSLLKLDVHYVIASRNPLSVVQSLARRDSFLPEHSLQLWQNYLLACLQYTQGESRLIVDFDLLMAEPAQQLARVAKLLDVPFSADDAAFIDYETRFLDSSLRHTSFGGAELEQSLHVSQSQRDLYQLLTALAKEQVQFSDHAVVTQLEHLLQEHTALQPLLRFAGMQQRELARLRVQPLQKPLQSCLYTDYGQGFNEADVQRHALLAPYKRTQVRFELAASPEQTLHTLRLDPIDVPCVVKLHKVVLMGNEIEQELTELTSSNAFYHQDQLYYFLTYDPQFIVALEPVVHGAALIVEAEFEFVAIEEDALALCREKQAQQGAEQQVYWQQTVADLQAQHELTLADALARYNDAQARWQDEQDALLQTYEREKSDWKQERKALLQSSSWRLTQPLRNVRGWFRGSNK